jgi:hypothetical protein
MRRIETTKIKSRYSGNVNTQCAPKAPIAPYARMLQTFLESFSEKRDKIVNVIFVIIGFHFEPSSDDDNDDED